jgi:uncharacterized membrane protein
MFPYFAVLYLISLFLGYTLIFNRATLLIGTEISYDNSPTGFQDAVTPPWLTSFSIFSYVVSLGWIVFGFYKFGIVIGIVSIIALIIVAFVNIAIVLPKRDSDHFEKLILNSMLNRYANYVKDGDELRAAAMGDLLERLDIPVSEIRDK